MTRRTQSVRVRFAPSPTGELHVGSVWVAQFNWLYAQQHHGVFVLRIEDTDQRRLVPGALEKIYQALAWYQLVPDEGPEQGGRYGPYIQSQRRAFYRRYAEELIEQGSAYFCFCTSQRLEELKKQQQAHKQPPRYDKRCSAIPVAQARRRIMGGESAVIRLSLPTTGTIVHTDMIRKQMEFRFSELDDSVIMKSDGFPTYHLAVVVDDHLMNISHVIRAEEWLSSLPKHLYLYRALKWDPPQFAHLPLILGTDRSKLSKRHGATAALSFRDQGYLAEAMKNFLVLMGWHPQGDEEIVSFNKIMEQFRLEDVHASGAVFDRTKLDWMNGVYIRRLTPSQLLERLSDFWHIPPREHPQQAWKLQALGLVRERLRRLSDIDELINFVFSSVWNREVKYFDRHLLIPKQGTGDTVKSELQWAAGWLGNQPDPWMAERLKPAMLQAIREAGKSNLSVLWPVRVALTLRAASPDVFDVLALLRKTESLRRLQYFLVQ